MKKLFYIPHDEYPVYPRPYTRLERRGWFFSFYDDSNERTYTVLHAGIPISPPEYLETSNTKARLVDHHIVDEVHTFKVMGDWGYIYSFQIDSQSQPDVLSDFLSSKHFLSIRGR